MNNNNGIMGAIVGAIAGIIVAGTFCDLKMHASASTPHNAIDVNMTQMGISAIGAVIGGIIGYVVGLRQVKKSDADPDSQDKS